MSDQTDDPTATPGEGPLEDELDQSFTSQVEEGEQRLARSWREVLVTGFLGGTEVAIGVLAYLVVLDQTGDHLLAGLAFSAGFIALLLGHSELFTEGFLVPVVTVAAKRGTSAQLARLWSGTLVGNLVGGWLITWLVVAAFPDLHPVLVESAAHYVEAPIDVHFVALTVLAGAVMTLLTRMQHGTDDVLGRIVAAVVVGFLLAGAQLFHSILDSLLVFGAIHTGDAGFGYLDWLRFVVVAIAGNMAGGLGLVTLVRLVRSKDRVVEERRANAG